MFPAGERVFTVSEITECVKLSLESDFPLVNVEGEISNCRPASSGHLYFYLKDRSAMIQAVMFRYKARGLGFEPRDGMLVRAKGAITVYAARGQYQILVEGMQRSGEGELLAMLEERKRALAAEGLFDEARKRNLPRFPARIAVVTSATGAAIRDILNVLGRRNAGMDIVVLPAAVQGEEAAAQIVRQIEAANRWDLGEVLIVGRGGGSLEDLLPFSDEAVVRAIASSRIPVISAVGHEIDWALSDYAADLRAPTPSAAAELVSESREALSDTLRHLQTQLAASIASRLERARLLLGRFEPHAAEAQLMRVLMPSIRRLDEAGEGLTAGVRAAIDAPRQRIELAWRSLEAASPEAVLARGFAVVRKPGGGKAVRDSSQLGAGDDIDILFARGGAGARVQEVRK